MTPLAVPIWLPMLLAVSGVENAAEGDAGRVRLEYLCRRPPAGIVCESCVTPRRDTGVIREMNAWTLTLSVAATEVPLEIPREAVTRAWVEDGTRPSVLEGMAIGLIAGGVVGGVIGSTQEFCIFDCAPATGLGILMGMPLGTLTGGIVGSMTRSTRWRQVSADMLLRDAVPASGAGLSLTRTW